MIRKNILLEKEIEKLESSIKSDEEAKKAFDAIKKKLNYLETEDKRFELIKKELKKSEYKNVFDTAIENVRLEEELKYLKQKKIEEKITWHNSPNIKILLYLLGVAGIVWVLVLATKYTQNYRMFKTIIKIEKKMNNIENSLKINLKKSKAQDNNASR